MVQVKDSPLLSAKLLLESVLICQLDTWEHIQILYPNTNYFWQEMHLNMKVCNMAAILYMGPFYQHGLT